MKILAIDTSCDDSCAAIVDTQSRRLLADVVHSHVERMSQWGGIVPEIASREHLRGLPLAVKEALSRAQMESKDLDWIVATNRPGLIGALLVGVTFAKSLAYATQIPFTALNHIEGHLLSPLIATLESRDGKTPPPFPWIAAVVSGGHTELFHVRSAADFKWLGGTLDDAAGEAFDKIGKLVGLPYPAGPLIDKLVRETATDADRKKYKLPRATVDGFHFSYSGLKTAVSQEVRKLGDKLATEKVALLASAQEAILEPLVEKIKMARMQLGVESVVVSGGVACNSRLRALLPAAFFPEPRHCTDNAAMLATLALVLHDEGRLVASPWNVTAHARAD